MGARRPQLPERYELPELVAHGGMADVYRATDASLERTVAIKVLSERYAADPEIRLRFTREALTAASLSHHPNIVTIYDVGEAAGTPYIVMEYLSGGSLADRVKAGAVPPVLALAWLDQAARGLDAAHRAGVVHRDVKPANLLLGGDGEVRVTDFGIARAAAHDPLTSTGTILGTSGYMAPEQARGTGTSAASDRYALGCVAFELLTGRRPYVGESVAAEAAAHATAAIPSAASLDPQLPPAVDAVFRKVLAKDTGARHATAEALVADLRRALLAHEPAATRIVHGPGRDVPDHPRARRLLAAGLALAGLAAVGTGAGLVAGGDGGAREAATIVRTETRTTRVVETHPGQAEVRTVTVVSPVTVTATPPVASTDAPGPGPPSSLDEAAAANDRAYGLMQEGDFASALPILEGAFATLQGSRTLAEAYAAYNLAFTRLAVGSCDGVLDLLSLSDDLQGNRKEIRRLRDVAEDACGKGD